MRRRISIASLMLLSAALCLCAPKGKGQQAEPKDKDHQAEPKDKDRDMEPSLLAPSWPTLKSEFPQFESFSGKVKFFAYKGEPTDPYRKPDFAKWLEDAEEIGKPNNGEGFVEAGYDGKTVRYVKIVAKDGSGTFYWIEGNVVEVVQPIEPDGRLFMTQVGVYRWKRTYAEGVLKKTVSYRQGYPAGKIIYNIQTLEYWPDGKTPRTIRYFKTESDLEAGKWDKKLEFSEEGKPLPVETKP